jgi:hypothetical protein
VLTVRGVVWVRTTRAKNGPATRQDTSDIGNIQRCRISIERSAPTIAESHELVSVNLNALPDNSPNDGVQPRAVPATSQHTDPHSR